MDLELKNLFDEDQADRANYSDWLDPQKVIEIGMRDQARRSRLEEMITQGVLKTPQDYVHAAFIFQHGSQPADYKLANDLAKKAVEMGDDGARWIYAATLDRWLMSEGKLQKFGTQYQTIDGKTVLAPVDPNTTDEERLKHHIKPLAQIPKIFKPPTNET